MNGNVILAVFLRNLRSYFSNPTGYVFICVFVVLCAFAAFWPSEFFNANLANLDQLNRYLPYILLIFVPAITMSVWADERRLGTDELLLTIPASDMEVVLGKYLAVVAIFTISLVFSLWNAIWLAYWGDPDWGLMLGNYFGYWVVGLAMLAVGMMASFLTSNLTVGFVLGVLFNAPLVFAGSLENIPGISVPTAQRLRNIGIAEQFHDFGRGVVSFNSLLYFGLITVVMLYCCMVLIGRRHWMGGKTGQVMLGHYVARVAAMAGAMVGLLWFAANFGPLRQSWVDVTSERLSTLSPETRDLIKNISPEQTVVVDAYVSPVVPEAYVQQRLNVLNVLREFDRLGGNNVDVRIHNTEPLSDSAVYADQQFGIKPRQVVSRTRGALKAEEIFLALAVTSGLEKSVVPFVDRGVSAEYELLRSVAVVSKKEKEKIGVLTTDAKLFASFDMMRGTPGEDQLLIEELRKQYEVVQVNADAPIEKGRFKVLLAVQPSSLGPEPMTNFINAVKAGIPTAIFEDPMPVMDMSISGTSMPKNSPGGMFGMNQPAAPKGNIKPLWDFLHVGFGPKQSGDEVVWQDYNPYPKMETFEKMPQFVFIDRGNGSSKPFSESDEVTESLQQLLIPFGGWIDQEESTGLKFEPLLRTGERSGILKVNKVMLMGRLDQEKLDSERVPKSEEYIMAARISGKPAKKTDEAAHEEHADDETSKSAEINVVLTADIDCLYSVFFHLRQQGAEQESDIPLDVDNVAYVLNVLDSLAEDRRFIDVRSRRRRHRSLTAITAQIDATKKQVLESQESIKKKMTDEVEKVQKELFDKVEEIQKRTDLEQGDKFRLAAMQKHLATQRLTRRQEELERERDRNLRNAERELDAKVRQFQGTQKLMAVVIPPLFPLIVGIWTFFTRRLRETEGVSRKRMRSAV